MPEARITVAHGKMDKERLEDIWADMLSGNIDILVSTTIIETGVDIPNANTLIVEHAQRLGLSQLHQIRGRVGRSSRRAYAYFTFPKDKTVSEIATKRLEAIREYAEFGAGFKIALRDLEIRGAGNILGAEQHGHLDAVGYDLYIKLLNEAVLEERGEKIEEKIESTISLKCDAYIPEKYVSYSSQRMELYKKIANIETPEDKEDIIDEMIDRFGDIPRPVENLIRIAQLRGATRKLGVSHLFLKPDGLHFRLDEKHMPELSLMFEAITRTDPRFRFEMGKTPGLTLAQRALTPESALKEAIPLMEKVLENIRTMSAQQAPAEEGGRVNE
jgi:transcription-repair coupling factor (superfamily II helicase)